VPAPHDVAAFAAARERVLAAVREACVRVGRDPAGVTLVAVSKTVAAERLVTAVAAGLTTLGENRVQEGESKAALVPGATWHLIGPLQSNKAKRALATFAVIQSVDTVELAERLDRLAGEVRPNALVPILLQVNVDRDPAKAGLDPDDLERGLERLDACHRLDVRGLMTVGRFVDDPEAARPTFVALRRLSDRVRLRWAGLGPDLSMGMSDDYPIAIEEGATIVRVGRALFGDRPHP
jgi:pyridoxal phosphate enzyme (YggS family)